MFVADPTSRVKCSEVIMKLTTAFENVSKRECGFIVRQSFPIVKRVHSNHVYYYEGIRRIVDTEDDISKTLVSKSRYRINYLISFQSHICVSI